VKTVGTSKARMQNSIGSRVVAQRDEIERAVSRVKGYRQGYWPARQDRESRYSQGNNVSLAGRRPKLWGRTSKGTDEWDRVNVVGKVPRAFFRWLKDQTDTDWAALKMLEQCLFEEQ
jgi:hypothetical protein